MEKSEKRPVGAHLSASTRRTQAPGGPSSSHSLKEASAEASPSASSSTSPSGRLRTQPTRPSRSGFAARRIAEADSLDASGDRGAEGRSPLRLRPPGRRLHEGGDARLEILVVEGLVDDVEGDLEIGPEKARRDDDPLGRAIFAEELYPIVAAEDVHAIIGNDEVDVEVEELFQGAHAVRGDEDLVAFLAR